MALQKHLPSKSQGIAENGYDAMTLYLYDIISLYPYIIICLCDYGLVEQMYGYVGIVNCKFWVDHGPQRE